MMNTPVGMLMNQKGAAVVTVPDTVAVADAVRVMNEHRIGSVVVLSARGVVGIFTERDVLTRVVAAGRNPYVTRVTEVMTANLVTVSPTHTVAEVMEICTSKRCRHLPVMVNEEMIGLISIGDITRWLVDKHRAEAEHLRSYIAGELTH
jgi:CBS domain-containing protein